MLNYIKFINESEVAPNQITKGTYVVGKMPYAGLDMVNKIGRVEADLGENAAVRFLEPSFAKDLLGNFSGKLASNCGKIIPKRFLNIYENHSDPIILHDNLKMKQTIEQGDIVIFEGYDISFDDINGRTGLIKKSLGGGKYEIRMFSNFAESDEIYDKYQFLKNDEMTLKVKEGIYKATICTDRLFSYCNILKTFSDITYLDVTDKNDEISYLPLNRIDRLNGGNPFESTMRQTTKIGKILTKFFPGMSQSKIEKEVNKYKAKYDNVFINTNNAFQIVDGEQIKHWYNEINYTPGGGSLNNSCMRYGDKDYVFNIYTENPNKIKMLILKNRNNPRLIDGRAIIWFLDQPGGLIFMDRVYTVDDHKRILFFEYAKKNGWRFYNDRGEIDKFSPPNDMKVYFDKDYGPCNKNPYMDTMKYFNNRKKYISNKPPGGLEAATRYNCY